VRPSGYHGCMAITHHTPSDVLRHPLHAMSDEAHHLLEVEREGQSGETIIVSLGRVLCVIVPMLTLMMVLAFAAAWLFG
jgi:hypothetical protein